MTREVRDRTSRYLSFLCFLRGISSVGGAVEPEAATPSSPSSEALPVARSPLTLLNQGPETAHVYRDLIAAYAGIPMGDGALAAELTALKRLTVALARRGF